MRICKLEGCEFEVFPRQQFCSDDCRFDHKAELDWEEFIKNIDPVSTADIDEVLALLETV